MRVEGQAEVVLGVEEGKDNVVVEVEVRMKRYLEKERFLKRQVHKETEGGDEVGYTRFFGVGDDEDVMIDEKGGVRF